MLTVMPSRSTVAVTGQEVSGVRSGWFRSLDALLTHVDSDVDAVQP
ncbi:MAG: hypothetical protein MRJ92_11020 [Nitrospira sp.]|nr:hypothetical protein [Nitrospira sp.]